MAISNQLMACKLILESASEGIHPSSFEWEFQESEVHIGRGHQCQLFLDDFSKVISSQHALIKQEKGQYFLSDNGSMNGTLLDGIRLKSGQSYPLSSGSRIGIAQDREHCVVTLRFEVHAQPANDAIDFNDESTIPLKSLLTPPLSLVDQIQEDYWDWSSLPEESRQEKICQFLRDQVVDLEKTKAEEVLNLLDATYPITDNPPIYSSPNEENGKYQGARIYSAHKRNRQELGETKRYLETLVGHPLSAFDEQEMSELDERMVQSLHLILEYLIAGITGRRQFEQQMGLQITAILSKKHNSMKWAMSAKELGANLFNIRKEAQTTDEVLVNLKEMLQDVTQHQQGVMEGLRECVKGVLEELHPDKIKRSARGRTFSPANTALPWLFNWMTGAACWKEYQDCHKSFLEEEQKLMEKVIRPYFEKGYLRAHSPISKES